VAGALASGSFGQVGMVAAASAFRSGTPSRSIAPTRVVATLPQSWASRHLRGAAPASAAALRHARASRPNLSQPTEPPTIRRSAGRPSHTNSHAQESLMGHDGTHFPISVILTVSDCAKHVAYFRDVLGFTLEQSWPDANKPFWANLMMDGQSVMMGQLMDPNGAGAEMCAHDEGAKKYMEVLYKEFQANQRGVGIMTYIMVKDIDAYQKQITAKGAKVPAPKNQFYGLREVPLQDPEGYRFMFYSLIKMENCQSCGMPMKDAQPGTMYCHYCTDEHGKLKSYETVLEGTTTGYFMQMQKLPRDKAEKAARELLAKQPAWMGRKSGPEKVGSH
jgi:uncharacterized glyoxalase superfamily protein PhnB